MQRQFSLKPDYQASLERFEAWWRCEMLDRPPVTLFVKPCCPLDIPGRDQTQAALRERWLNVEQVIDSVIKRLESQVYVGDRLPIYTPNVGPELSATPFGCELDFSETTSWASPIVHDASDWQRVLEMPLNFDNVYWQTIERLTDLALERAEGRYIVGLPDLHGNYDILASLREPQSLCFDVMDCPEVLKQVGRRVSEAYVEMFNRCYRKLEAAGMPCTTWLATLHEGPAYVPSSDFWCLVSDDYARDAILPDILVEMQPLQRSIFHLDGPQALRHLDLLLDMPDLDAVQWVYGAGGGRACDWLHVYRRIQEAGKAIQVVAVDPEDALGALRALSPQGFYLQVAKPFDSADQAEDFLAEVERLSKAAPSHA